jgi:type 1 fimbria pilin
MKKYGLCCPLLLIGFFASAINSPTSSVTFQVTGEIVARPCNISWPARNFDLGAWSSPILNAMGTYANSQTRQQTIQFSGCPAETRTASIIVTGPPDTTLPDTIFANTAASNKSEDVGLQLFYLNGQTPIAMGNNTHIDVPLGASQTTFNYFARIITLHGKTTPGNFTSTITMNVTWQ